MSQSNSIASFDLLVANVVRSVIDATAKPGETAEQTSARTRVIVLMFESLGARDPIQAMLAAQYIAMRHALMDAMKDLSDPGVDLKTRTRMRAVTVSMSRSLDAVLNKLQRKKAKTEAPAAEKPAPPAAKAPLAPMPDAPLPDAPANPLAWTPPSRPAQTLKAAMLGSTTLRAPMRPAAMTTG